MWLPPRLHTVAASRRVSRAVAGPALFHTDPSGTHTRFDAKAIGAGAEGAQTALQEQFHKNLTLQEGETMAVTILKQASH